jgi:hypothetical protein
MDTINILREMEIEAYKKELLKVELKIQEAKKYNNIFDLENYNAIKLFTIEKLRKLGE